MNITNSGDFMYKGGNVMLSEAYYNSSAFRRYGCRPDWGLIWSGA